MDDDYKKLMSVTVVTANRLSKLDQLQLQCFPHSRVFVDQDKAALLMANRSAKKTIVM